MADDEVKGGEPGAPASGEKSASDNMPKPSFKPKEVYKKEGPKGSKEYGNRKPDPNAPKKTPGKELNVGPYYKADTKSDHSFAFDTKAGAQDKTFVQGLKVTTSDLEVLSASVDTENAKGKLVGAKFNASASVLHGEVDLVEKIVNFFFPKPKPPAAPPMPNMSMAPMAARVGDLTAHGGPLFPGPASADVYIGGLPAWRATMDVSLCAMPGAAPHGGGVAMLGEPTVLVNGMPLARMGDFVVEPTGGPNVIITGAMDVFVGTPAGPPPVPPPVVEPPKEPPWVIFGAVATGDMVTADAKADASVEWDAKEKKGKAEVAAGIEAAIFRAKVPFRLQLRVPGTTNYIGLGLTVEGSALSVGAEAGGGLALNKDGKAFKVDGGAKVGAGLIGVGAKFSVDYGPAN